MLDYFSNVAEKTNIFLNIFGVILKYTKNVFKKLFLLINYVNVKPFKPFFFFLKKKRN